MFAPVIQAGPATAGDHTLGVQILRPPLGLTVTIGRLVRPFASTDPTEPATLRLALIGNAHEVTLAAGRDTFTVTARSASSHAGSDVEELGKDRRALAEDLSPTDHEPRLRERAVPADGAGDRWMAPWAGV